MSEQLPWFMYSPSPVSLLQYAILSWYASRQLLKAGVKYKRFPRVFSFIDGFFIMGFFVVLGDAVWAGFCALKWVPLFPQDLDQILFSFFRDVAGCFLFFLFLPLKLLNFNRKAKIALLIMVVSQGLWFLLAPSPAFTDYTFAWRHGFPLEHLIPAFLLSHFIMRLPQWYAFYQVMQIEDNTIYFKKDEPLNSELTGD